jgi:glycosyltransferase involved in cell wall biosynthesis
MACGRPAIVGSKVGGARDLIATGINGWTFESGNLGQLTDAIRKALSCTPERLHAMGAAAQRESQRWSIEAAAQGIENAVTAAVDAGSRPISLNETVARTR